MTDDRRSRLELELADLRDELRRDEAAIDRKKELRNRLVRRLRKLPNGPSSTELAVLAGISQPMVSRIAPLDE